MQNHSYLFFLQTLLLKVDHFLQKVISLRNPRFYRKNKDNHCIPHDVLAVMLSMKKIIIKENSYKKQFGEQSFSSLDRPGNSDLIMHVACFLL